MPNLAEAAALFSYGYWEQADGQQTPDLTDRLGGPLPANWQQLWSWI